MPKTRKHCTIKKVQSQNINPALLIMCKVLIPFLHKLMFLLWMTKAYFQEETSENNVITTNNNNFFYQHTFQTFCNRTFFKQPCCYVVEVGCLGHSGASTISSQVQDGNCTDSWQNLATQPWAPTPLRRQAPITLIHSGKQRVRRGRNKYR